MASTLHIIKRCDTPDSRAEGLQNIEITKDECCLFLFDAKSQHTFWGLNTPQQIWVNFVTDNGGILAVREAKPIYPNNLSPVKSIGKYSIAFESLNNYLSKQIIIRDDAIEIVG